MLEQQHFPFPVFLAEIGATNARFAHVPVGASTLTIQNAKCADFQSFHELLQFFLGSLPANQAPKAGAIAVPCPVTSDLVSFTNLPWQFSIEAIRQAFHLEKFFVRNDFEATAMALPYMDVADLFSLTAAPLPASDRPLPKIVLGPGSGFGCAGLIPYNWQHGVHWVPAPGEAGHMSLSPQNAKEDSIITRLRQIFGHVSVERVLSGPGIASLYALLYTEKERQLQAILDIDPEDGDVLPEGSQAYPSQTRFQKFEGLTDITFDGQLPKVQPARVAAIIPKRSSADAGPQSEVQAFASLKPEQIALLALQAEGLQPPPAFQKELPPLPENPPKEIQSLAGEAMGYFFQFLGSVAGNLALTFGAQGGVYLAGGLLPKVQNLLAASNFRTMFQSKGRFSQYLSQVPLYLITHPAPALVGLNRLMWEEFNKGG